MNQEILRRARDFYENQRAFHLGFLPTEQSNPLTARVDADFARSSAAGVATLQRPDRDVLAMARRVLTGDEFAQLTGAVETAMRAGGRVVTSGCGATGRLSLLLEAMWRDFFHRRRGELAPEERQLADRMAGIMTGGDYALIKSVESFEDFAVFGRRQVAELGLGPGDVLIGITEGGETSSVLGTVMEAARRGCRVFLVFNNPAELLCEKLERSREAISDPRITVLDLYCGSMAIAGSTRMQATTAEQLVVGAALETALGRLLPRFAAPVDFAAAFAELLDQLEAPAAVAALAECIDFEDGIYRAGGRITYHADDFMLDIFTDTTERSPTFMLPPFRSREEKHLPQPWAFVKNPHCATREAWERVFHRELRCLEWTSADYRAMDAPEHLVGQPPAIGRDALLKFEIGWEPAPERLAHPASAVVPFAVDAAGVALGERRIPVRPVATPLRLFTHLAVKLVLNTLSTGVMIKQGRVAGNWMSWVSVSNKKLIDRGIRLVADLGKLDYFDACCRVFEAIDELDRPEWQRREKPSPVQLALKKVTGRG